MVGQSIQMSTEQDFLSSHTLVWFFQDIQDASVISLAEEYDWANEMEKWVDHRYRQTDGIGRDNIQPPQEKRGDEDQASNKST